MSERPTRFEDLIRAIRKGSPSAARKLHDQFGDHILRIVRRVLHPRMRSCFDSIDFRQDVWASFFALPAGGTAFRTPEEVAGYLAMVAKNKVAEATRAQIGGAKRAMRRERSLDAFGADEFIHPTQATPSQEAIAGERWDEILRGKLPLLREILKLLRAHYTHEEIARRTGMHPKTVQRFVRKMKERIKE